MFTTLFCVGLALLIYHENAKAKSENKIDDTVLVVGLIVAAAIFTGVAQWAHGLIYDDCEGMFTPDEVDHLVDDIINMDKIIEDLDKIPDLLPAPPPSGSKLEIPA